MVRYTFPGLSTVSFVPVGYSFRRIRWFVIAGIRASGAQPEESAVWFQLAFRTPAMDFIFGAGMILSAARSAVVTWLRHHSSSPQCIRVRWMRLSPWKGPSHYRT